MAHKYKFTLNNVQIVMKKNVRVIKLQLFGRYVLVYLKNEFKVVMN